MIEQSKPFLHKHQHTQQMNPLSRSKSDSSRRGRSREPRDSYDDDDNSFESWESSRDDESYEPESDRHLEYKESTEYESDNGSYISDSEPPTPSQSATDEYESDDSESLEEDANIVSMDSLHSEDSGISTSADEFANEEDDESDDFEDDTENDEDSFGEFKVDDDRFRNKTFDSNEGEEDESNLSDSDSDNDDDSGSEGERVNLGQTDDDLFWKRYGYSQNNGNFGDNESKGTSEDEFDGSDSFKDEPHSQAIPSIARMRTEDSREEIADPERLVKSGDGLFDKAKGWFHSKWPKSDNSAQRSESPKSNSWFEFSDVLQGNFKWYILGAFFVIVLIAILGGTLSKKNKDKNIDKNVAIGPQPIRSIDMAPSATPTISSSPTLPPGQVIESITFFVLIPNGKDNGITEEEIEIEFLAAFDVLAPQVLFNTTQINNSRNTTSGTEENQTVVASEEKVNNTVGLRGRRRRRRLKALSIKSPLSIEIAIIGMFERNQ